MITPEREGQEGKHSMRKTIIHLLYKTVVLLVVVVPLVATALAIVLLWQRAVHWSDLGLLASMYVFVAIGVTVGYHRMLTHRSFVPHPASCGSASAATGWNRAGAFLRRLPTIKIPLR
jgi:fatty-acid desaturase